MPTISINVAGLWNNWLRSQRDSNISTQVVANYVNQINAGQALKPIEFDGVFVDDGGHARIKTADGRHRVVAAHQAQLQTIDAEDTPIACSIKEIFNL